LDWPDARATRPFRRQGQGEGARRALRRAARARGPHAVSLEEARVFFAAQNGAGVMIKAIGGGGCGIRAVRRASDVEEAYRHSRQC